MPETVYEEPEGAEGAGSCYAACVWGGITMEIMQEVAEVRAEMMLRVLV